MWRRCCFILSGILFACSSAQLSEQPGIPAVEGARLFKAKGCYTCHTIGQGVKVGPDLQGLFSRREEAWVRRYLSDPVGMAAQDPIARQLKETFKVQMPKLMLSPSELDQLIVFLKEAGVPGAETR